IAGTLLRLFGLPFSRGGINHVKSSAAERYRPCFDAIVRRLVGGKLLHVDETQAKVKGQDGYVWAFTSLEDVAFVRFLRRGVFFGCCPQGSDRHLGQQRDIDITVHLAVRAVGRASAFALPTFLSRPFPPANISSPHGEMSTTGSFVNA